MLEVTGDIEGSLGGFRGQLWGAPGWGFYGGSQVCVLGVPAGSSGGVKGHQPSWGCGLGGWSKGATGLFRIGGHWGQSTPCPPDRHLREELLRLGQKCLQPPHAQHPQVAQAPGFPGGWEQGRWEPGHLGCLGERWDVGGGVGCT